ncbi:MAG TPA: HAD hydrolase-like protein, partial [Chitinophagales bacterium]
LTIDRADANTVMGIPKPDAIEILLCTKFEENPSKNRVDEIHKVFVADMINFYKTDASVKAKLNAEATFKALREKGIKVSLDTGFSRDITDTILERLNWKNNDTIDFSVTSDEVAKGRPHPDLIFKAMEITGFKADEIAKVGDTISDLHEGTSAGCKFVIGITTGAYSHDELAKEPHTHLVNDLLEVVEIVA